MPPLNNPIHYAIKFAPYQKPDRPEPTPAKNPKPNPSTWKRRTPANKHVKDAADVVAAGCSRADGCANNCHKCTSADIDFVREEKEKCRLLGPDSENLYLMTLTRKHVPKDVMNEECHRPSSRHALLLLPDVGR